MSGEYAADPSSLRQIIGEMKRLPEMAKKMRDDFRSHENDFTDWPGWTDDFARETRPKYEENNEHCVSYAMALYEALDGLVAATLTNLENIEGTRTDATDRIRAHQAKTDEALGGDEGQGRR